MTGESLASNTTLCPTQSWVDNIEKSMKDESWIASIENREKGNIEDNEEEKNSMKNTEADEKEESGSENTTLDTDDPNLSESDCKSEAVADLMNHKKADHDEILGDNSGLGSRRLATVMVEGEDGLAPAYREVIRELEEHRQHFKVETYQMCTRFQGRFLPNL